MVVKTYKGDKVTKLTVEETFRFRGNIGGIAAISKGAVNAKLDGISDSNGANTVESRAILSQREIVKTGAEPQDLLQRHLRFVCISGT